MLPPLGSPRGLTNRFAVADAPSAPAEKAILKVLRSLGQSELRPSMSVAEIGDRIHLALEANKTSWIALSTASLYWRAKGKPFEAIECLRRAFFFAPSGSKDLPLVGLANVLHLGGFTLDAITTMQMAIQVCCERYSGRIWRH